MLNVNRLRILAELERQGTLANVAAALRYTPSAVSQQLAQLEREAGVALLDRVGRTVRLTDAAHTLVRHAQTILRALDAAEADLAAEQGPASGTVRIASFHTVLLEIAPLALTLLARDAPDLSVHLTHREVDEAHLELLSHEFDLVLGEEFPGAQVPRVAGAHRSDFRRDPLWLAVPRARDWAPRRLADCAELPWAVEPTWSRLGQWALNTCRAAGFTPRAVVETPDPLLHLELVRTGHAVSFVPGLIGAEYLEGIDVYALPGRPARTLYTEVRSGRERHPALLAVRRAFAQASKQLEPVETAGALRADG